MDVSIKRSSQLDAERLDEELSSMLREQFQRAFALFRPGTVARLQPELALLLDFLVRCCCGCGWRARGGSITHEHCPCRVP